MHTKSLPSDSLSKLFLISARNGVSSFTPWFPRARAPLHRVRLTGARALNVQRLARVAHSIEELARRVYCDNLGWESVKKKLKRIGFTADKFFQYRGVGFQLSMLFFIDEGSNIFQSEASPEKSQVWWWHTLTD